MVGSQLADTWLRLGRQLMVNIFTDTLTDCQPNVNQHIGQMLTDSRQIIMSTDVLVESTYSKYDP